MRSLGYRVDLFGSVGGKRLSVPVRPSHARGQRDTLCLFLALPRSVKLKLGSGAACPRCVRNTRNEHDGDLPVGQPFARLRRHLARRRRHPRRAARPSHARETHQRALRPPSGRRWWGPRRLPVVERLAGIPASVKRARWRRP